MTKNFESRKVLLGVILMTIPIVQYTIVPPMADLLGTTHVFNEAWTSHARFHTVWLLCTTSSIGLLALYFLWFYQDESNFGINLAGVLSCIVLGSFMLSAATTSLYGGALSDAVSEGGVAQNALGLGLNTNLVIFVCDAIFLFLGWPLTRSRNV